MRLIDRIAEALGLGGGKPKPAAAVAEALGWPRPLREFGTMSWDLSSGGASGMAAMAWTPESIEAGGDLGGQSVRLLWKIDNGIAMPERFEVRGEGASEREALRRFRALVAKSAGQPILRRRVGGEMAKHRPAI